MPPSPITATRMGIAARLLLIAFAWLACAVAVAGEPPSTANGVGFATFKTTDPVRGDPMTGYVFYPAAVNPGKSMRVGVYDIDAVEDARPLPGAKPLVLISHGHGGSGLGHADLATYLAGHGFVVATITHPGDNFRDSSLDGHAEVWGGRPVQISAAIDALLRDPHWSPLIAADRIGVAGFSNGGYTALMLVGAKAHVPRFADYCRRYAHDAMCAGADAYRSEAARRGQTIEQFLQGIQDHLGDWGRTSDPRVKSAFAMAPMSVMFDADSLSGIDRPVFLYYGEADSVLRPSENAARIRPLLKTLVGTRVIPKADHWVFIPPCTRELAAEVPDICRDPPGVDRAAEHARINADALAFFRTTLGGAAAH